jgi:DNA-binding NarL/FixJ family response regulator
MIGKETLLNDGIKKNLISKDEFEVHHIAPQHINRHDFKSPKTKFKLTLIDLSSFSGRSVGCIEQIAQKEPSDYLVVLHTDSSNSSVQKLLDSGANRCLPIDINTDKLIEIVSQFRV